MTVHDLGVAVICISIPGLLLLAAARIRTLLRAHR